MAVQAGIKIGVEGEREYRQALANINQQTKELTSEMNMLTSSFDKNTSAEAQNAAKAEVLQKQIDNQANKVALLTDKYNREQSELARLKSEMERATTEYGANSKEAQKATEEYNKFATQTSKTKTSLNQAQTELNKMTKQLDEAKNPTQQEADALEDVGKEAKGAGEQGLKFGDVLKANVVSEAIIGGVKALASAMRDVAKGLVDTFTDTVQWADDLHTLSQVSGVSTERLQELYYASGLVDVEVTTITGAMTKMVKSMNTAADGTGDAAEAYAALGVAVTDANGNLRDQNDVFNEVIDALGHVDNETQRDAYAMSILGKSARELNPLIEAGSDQLAAWADEAHQVGYVLDNETVESLSEVQDSLDRIKNAGDATRRKLVAAFAPAISDALEKITPLLQGVGESVAELVAPAVEWLGDALQNLKKWLDSMDASTKKQAASFAMMAVALAPTLPLLSSAVNIAKALGGALAALASNPATLAIVAAGAAIAGVAIAIANVEAQHRAEIAAAVEAATEITRYTEAERDLMNAAEGVASAMSASREATDQAAASLSWQRGHAYDLVAQLQSLADVNGKVSESNEAQAQVIINELNSAYGLEIQLIDGQIQGYEDLAQSVYDVIDAKTAEALLDRRRDDYLDALENEQTLIDAITTAHNNATEAQETYNTQRALADRLTRQYQENLLTMTRAESDELERQIEAAEQAADVAHENWMQSVADEAEFNQQYLQNSRLIQNYDAAMVAAQRGNTQEVINLMTGRSNAWHDYGDAVDAATAQALDDMYDEVIAAAEYAAEVRTNWENGVDGYTEGMVTEAENAYKAMLGKFEAAYNDAYDVGFDFMSGLDNGLNSQLSQLKNTANSIAGVIPHGMRDALGIHSPSRVAAEIGRMFDLGLVQGMERGNQLIEHAADAQADAMVGAFTTTNSVFGSASMGAVVGGNSSSVNYGGVSITVNASDEQQAEEIAELVMEQMQNAVDRKRAVYA